MGAALALLSSLTWGVADFMGGIASRKRSVMQVLVIAYPVGAVVLTGVAIFLVPGELSSETFVIGALAGAIGATAIGCLYVALKRGPMGIVSPITAVMSAAIPVFSGLLDGEIEGNPEPTVSDMAKIEEIMKEAAGTTQLHAYDFNAPKKD